MLGVSNNMIPQTYEMQLPSRNITSMSIFEVGTQYLEYYSKSFIIS